MNKIYFLVLQSLALVAVAEGEKIAERFQAFTFEGTEYEFVLTEARLTALPKVDRQDPPITLKFLLSKEEIFRRELARRLNIKDDHRIRLKSIEFRADIPGASWSWKMIWRVMPENAPVEGGTIGNIRVIDSISALILMDGHPVYPTALNPKSGTLFGDPD